MENVANHCATFIEKRKYLVLSIVVLRRFACCWYKDAHLWISWV